MRIGQLDTFTLGGLGIVRVEMDDGGEGFGQVSPFNADITATVFHRQVAPHVLGAEVNRPEDLHALAQSILEKEYKFPGSYVRRALTGLDTALWDLLGKRAGKPICELLGGRPKAIPAYGSSMRRDIAPQAEAERLVRLRETRSFGAFKVRIGKVTGHDADQWTGRTELLVATVRKALGSDVRILVDANSCYTPPRAIEVGCMLQDHGVCHFEEPCPYWEYEWTAEVARALDLPVAGGEQDCFLTGWRRMLAMRAVDIAQPDVCYVGGLTRAMRVAELARQAGLPVVPHSANRSMVLIFTLHMMAAIPNAGPHLEYTIEPDGWKIPPYWPIPEVRDGKVEVPSAPGWGVTVNPDFLAAAEKKTSAWKPKRP